MPNPKMKLSTGVIPASTKAIIKKTIPTKNGNDGHHFGDVFHFQLQWAEFFLHFLRKVGNLAEFGVHAGGDHDRFAVPVATLVPQKPYSAIPYR
jgi:hypothetical protein